MKDLLITSDGELVKNGSDISTCESDDLKYQKALCILMSIKKDWYLDHIGANLEEFMGKPIDKAFMKSLKKRIELELSSWTGYKNDDIFVSIKNECSNIKISVYLRNSDKLTSRVLDLDFDMVRGANVVIGGGKD